MLFQLQFLESTIEDFEFREYTEFEFNSKKTQTAFENVCKETQTCQTDAIKEKKDVYLKRTNFRVYIFSRISRILVDFAKLNTREIFF